jgi:predicted O-methyltransferase YrrM
VLPLVEEILRSKQVRTADGLATLPLKDSINIEIGNLLQKLIVDKRPSVSLEIGLAYGLSTLFICEALAQVGGQRHIAIDAFQSSMWSGIGLHNVRSAGFGNLLELREELSQDALPRLFAEGVKIDFAYIDGTHTFDQKIVDFFYIDRILNVGGVIAFDDCDWPSIHQVCRFIATNRPYRVCGSTAGTPPGIRGRIVKSAARHSKNLRLVVKPHFLQPDEQLGIVAGARCIAFEKLADYEVQPDYVFKDF